VVALINNDARGQASRISSLTSSITAVGQCRQSQVATWEQRLTSTRTAYVEAEADRAAALAAAADAGARRRLEGQQRRERREDQAALRLMTTEQTALNSAIRDDEKLFDDVLKHFDTDLRAMAEAQARVQGTSVASIRGPAETYAVEVLPPAILAGQLAAAAPSTGSDSAIRRRNAPPVAPVAPQMTEEWESRIRRGTPAPTPTNGHMEAQIASVDARAQAQAQSLSSLGRLALAVQRGNQIATGT
jgi:hypothetical protein